MAKFYKILLFLVAVLLFSQCKKDNDDWAFCIDCNNEQWAGNYEGVGVYYSDNDGKTVYDVPTTVTIESLSDVLLKTIVVAEDYFETSTTASKTDVFYYFEVPGSNGSLSLTLSKKGGDYKLSGTSKIYHQQGDSLFTDRSISFDVYKNLE